MAAVYRGAVYRGFTVLLYAHQTIRPFRERIKKKYSLLRVDPDNSEDREVVDFILTKVVE